MSQRCIVLIDGSNFYFKLKDLGLHNLLNFKFNRLLKLLAKSYQIINVCYYIGRIRQDGTIKSEKLFDAQQRLLGNLKKYNITYNLGFLLKSNGEFHEKGVDVQIAVDILVATYENYCDRIILVSSDTDLAPAIRKAREKGKIVEYIGFSHKPSFAMINFCSKYRLLTKNDLLPLFPHFNPGG